jgi:glutamate carboxypeptidase
MHARVMMRALDRELRGGQAGMLRLLGKLVRLESPSNEKDPLDRLASLLAGEWRRAGARVSLLRQAVRGNQIRAEVWLGRGRPAGRLLVLGHMDTVYQLGTLPRMPFHVKRGRAFGPGTFDMKGGLVIALFAARALRKLKIHPRRKLVFLWTSDEEIGSGASRALIEREARRSQAVLVLEPALGLDGRLKTRRKGVGEAELLVTGRAAHAGIDPDSGVNAVHELALQIERLRKMNDPARGITINATVVEGGTFVNVIPSEARARMDLRVSRQADARRLSERLRHLHPILPGARIEVRGGIDRRPLERTAGVVRLFRHAVHLSGHIGISLGEASTGGGSDGNFTAALGVPTLDGLGAVGEGAHSPGECVLVRALPQRAALLAGLLATL